MVMVATGSRGIAGTGGMARVKVMEEKTMMMDTATVKGVRGMSMHQGIISGRRGRGRRRGMGGLKRTRRRVGGGSFEETKRLDGIGLIDM